MVSYRLYFLLVIFVKEPLFFHFSARLTVAQFMSLPPLLSSWSSSLGCISKKAYKDAGASTADSLVSSWSKKQWRMVLAEKLKIVKKRLATT